MRFRQHLGLVHRAQSVAHLGTGLLAELAQQIEAHPGKHCSAEDYQRCLRRDILPYFGERYLEELTAADIAAFEMPRIPPESMLARAQWILREEGVTLPDEQTLHYLRSAAASGSLREYMRTLEIIIHLQSQGKALPPWTKSGPGLRAV